MSTKAGVLHLEKANANEKNDCNANLVKSIIALLPAFSSCLSLPFSRFLIQHLLLLLKLLFPKQDW